MSKETMQAPSTKALQIILIEDSLADVELVQVLLEKDGLHCHFEHVADLETLKQAVFSRTDWDLIIADYTLPTMNGIDALNVHAQYLANVPFIFFAGTMGEDLAIECLRRGATDYVLKERPHRLPVSVRRALQESAERRDREQVEEALRISEARYRTLYDNNPSMFFTLSPAAEILSVNEFATSQLGFDKQALLGQPFSHVLHPDDAKIAIKMLQSVIDTPGIVQRCEVRLRRASNEFFWVRKSVRAVDGFEGDLVSLVVCEDITEARQLSEELSYQATHDMLTGLANRREFEKRLSRQLDNCHNHKSEHVLLYLDLDQFKVINDTCGHVAGDELLRQLGDLLCDKVRRNDTIARLGGDEFGVLIEHCDQGQGLKIAESLRRNVEQFRFSWDEKTFTLGVSIGLVSIDVHSTNVPEIMSAADNACYAAKDSGRNRIQVYYDTDIEMSRRRGEMRWVSRINEALNDDSFYLVSQLIQPVLAAGNHGAHVELLIRMREADGHTVPPDAFLPAAERYNLAHMIDRWVINKAINWLTSTPGLMDRISLCCINLSAASMGKEDFLQYIENSIKEQSVPAKKLCFEITETSAIANLGNAQRFIKTLSELGCHFALDDFGTGMSSFAYLKNLPVHYLKIDGTFVRDIATDKIDRAMVRSINEIGHVMGKQTIAEFVENDVILAILRQLGVDYVQGYGIERPIPLEEAAANLLAQ